MSHHKKVWIQSWGTKMEKMVLGFSMGVKAWKSSPKGNSTMQKLGVSKQKVQQGDELVKIISSFLGTFFLNYCWQWFWKLNGNYVFPMHLWTFENIWMSFVDNFFFSSQPSILMRWTF